MSKGNMLLGQARGKVGSLVFSRTNGQQVVRARAEQVKNPQTDAQMVQRILLNTISQAYSKMNPIVDHSFEGIPAGQKSMSYFMKRNLSKIRQVLAESGNMDGTPPYTSPINSNLFALNNYEVSKGSLPDVNPSTMHADGIYVEATANTYKAVLDLLGLQRGDQLTFIIIDTLDYGHTKFRYSRVILDPRNDDGTEAPLTTAFVTAGQITKPNPKNEYNGVSFEYGDKFGTDVICASAPNDNIAGAMIASRQKEDGTWLRSNSTLVISEDGSIGYSVQEALDDFKSGGLEIINPKYLNNASKSFNNQPATVKHYTVLAVASPAAGGTVVGGGSYEEGTDVTLQATPNTGYRFVRWTEGGSALSTNNPVHVTATRNRNITAVFQEIEIVSIQTSANPAAGGNTSGGGSVEKGTSCTVNAIANAGYKFKRWTVNGSQVSTSASYTFTANASQTLVAEFEEVVTVAIATSSSPAAGGTTSGGGNIEQGTSCTIVATPAAGYQFVKWTENGADVSTQASYTFTANAAHNFVAVFEEHSGGFSNVTANGSAWNGNSLYIQSNQTVAGSIEEAPAGAQVCLAKSNTAPAALTANMMHGTSSISNNQFNIRTSDIEDEQKYWLVCYTGDANDGYVIAFTYPYYVTGYEATID